MLYTTSVGLCWWVTCSDSGVDPRLFILCGSASGMSTNGATPHTRFDKVRVLASKDVVYGRPQYVFHQVQDGSASGGVAASPWAPTPLSSGDDGQHLVVFRARDTRRIGSTQEGHGTSGTVMVQDAFDREGRLRVRPEQDALGPGAARSVRAYPCAEHDGSIFVYWGAADSGSGALRFADGFDVGDGVPVPVSTCGLPSLSERLAQASRSMVQDQLHNAAHLRSPTRTSTARLALADVHSSPPPSGASRPANRPPRAATTSPGSRSPTYTSRVAFLDSNVEIGLASERRGSPGRAHSALAAAAGSLEPAEQELRRGPGERAVRSARLSRAVAARLGTPARTMPLVDRVLGSPRAAAPLAVPLASPAGRNVLFSRQVGRPSPLTSLPLKLQFSRAVAAAGATGASSRSVGWSGGPLACPPWR